MTKFKVFHSCGHEAVHAHSGRDAQLRQRQEWLARQPCRECWRGRQAEAAQQQAEQWQLPSLEGSEDEVAWAEIIRAKALVPNREFRERMLRLSQTDSGEEDLCRLIDRASKAALQELEQITSAAWWIEHRFDALHHVQRATVAAAGPFLTPEDSPDD